MNEKYHCRGIQANFSDLDVPTVTLEQQPLTIQLMFTSACLYDLELRRFRLAKLIVMGDTCLDNLQPLSYSWFDLVSPWNYDQRYSY
jgi:hypothetical protein